jgi:hypothetical protein
LPNPNGRLEIIGRFACKTTGITGVFRTIIFSFVIIATVVMFSMSLLIADEADLPTPGIAAASYVQRLLADKADTDDVETTVSTLIPALQKGAANGVATLDEDGKVPTAQLPDMPVEQVQTDWDQSADTEVDYIKNKPALGSAAAKNIEDFATAEQGAKADSALQAIPVATTTDIGGFKTVSDTIQSVAANTVSAAAAKTYAVQKDAVGSAVVNVPWMPEADYSTSEVATGTRWINGKMIYKHSFSASVTAYNYYTRTQINSMAGYNVEAVIEIKAVWVANDGNMVQLPIGSVVNLGTNEIYVGLQYNVSNPGIDCHRIYINSNSSQTNDVYGTIYYTKTTG